MFLDRPAEPNAVPSLFAWLGGAFRLAPGHWNAALAFSVVLNLLLLVSPLYMLQVYDRVLVSGSADPLLWLTAIAIGLLVVYGAAETGRRRVLNLAALQVQQRMAARAFARLERAPSGVDLPQDLQAVCKTVGLFQSGAVAAYLDAPFTPFFLVIMFVVHPVLGFLGLAGAAILTVLAVLSETATRRAGAQAGATGEAANAFVHGLARQRGAMVAMGLAGRAYGRWTHLDDVARSHTLETTRIDGGFASASKAIRQGLQILVLAVGAGLALRQHVSPGSIVLGSIILGRALGPIDHIVGGWRAVAHAKAAWARLPSEALEEETPPTTALPRPEATLAIERVSARPPGATEPVVHPFSLRLASGARVALLGANGSGKTTLLQTLAGVWRPHAGVVRLGAREVHAWPSEDRGRHIGYLPQAIELLPGSVRDVIARFDPEVDDKAVFRAARRAGAHDAILSLPEGYDTPVGHGGHALSAGQRQLIGLARALLNDPVALFLDEPTANLDPNATAAVCNGLVSASQAGALVIAATHDARLIAIMNRVVQLQEGTVHMRSVEDVLSAQAPPSRVGRVEEVA